MGTMAYYTDTETSVGNTLTAAIMDLKVDNDPAGARFNWVDDPNLPVMQVVFGTIYVMPGWQEQIIVGVKNAGPDNVEGRADIKILNIVNADNGLEEPEPATGKDGDLGDAVEVAIYYGDKSVDPDAFIYVTGWTTLTAIEGTNFNAPATMLSGIDDFWVIKFRVPTSVGSEIMGDTVTFDVEFSLTQEP